MLTQNKPGKLFISFMMCLLFAQSAFAVDEWYKALPLLGSLGQVKKDSIITVQDDVFFDPSLKPNQTTYSVKNYFSLKINEASGVLLPANFSITIHFKLIATRVDGSGNQYIDSTSLPAGYPYVNISYSKSGTYNNRAVYFLTGAYRAKLRITAIDTVAGVPFSSYAGALVIENEMMVSREYNFGCSANAVTSVNTDTSYMASKAELRASWAKDKMANEYDLEWAYVGKSALSGDSSSGQPDPLKIFANNATRVSITNEEYYIPMLYDGDGTLFYRVRPVQIKNSGQRVEANWSSAYPGGLGSYIYHGHEIALNWQATTSFAEEGKRKTVVQYYDGSLRARQTVTKDNSTNTTVVSETFYDYQGRPAIQVLPAPTLNTAINYSRNFNNGLNSLTYDKNNFDSLYDPALYCNVAAAAMDSASGAAKYYSASNLQKDSGFHRFIPSAGGYPFAETEYMPDNTDRLRQQGGVGSAFRLNSGHQTTYYYGSPDQKELDAMFGSEAGDYSHYFKNMVKDANGQFSVSYVDMHGRTVATALAGTPPPDIVLDSLTSKTTRNITEALTTTSNTVIKDLVMESKKGLLVAKPATHTFTYQLNPQLLQKADCRPVNVCYNCLYDLEISITDDCNNQRLGGTAFDTVLHNFSIGAIDTSCGAGTGFSFVFSKYLTEGSYEITKKLSVSRFGMDYYRDSFYVRNNTCRNLASFVTEQRNFLAAVLQCKPTCQQCTDSLGTLSAFSTRFKLRAGVSGGDTTYDGLIQQAYNKAQADCDLLCNKISEYNDIRTSMLMDMTAPSGQYANADSLQDIYSIFYRQDKSQGNDTIADYRKPAVYLDEAGRPDTIYDEQAGTRVIPQMLSRSAFAQKFKNSWAEALLPYHPEYCKLQQYEALKTSHEWDRRFEVTDTYLEAMQKGYLNPTHNAAKPYSTYNATVAADVDPITSFGGHNYIPDLQDSLLKFKHVTNDISLWSFATATVLCTEKNNTCLPTYYDTSTAFRSMCTADLDMAWRNFRTLYLNIKKELISAQLKLSPCASTPTAAVLTNAHHQPYFSDASELFTANGVTLASSASQAQSQGQTAINSYYDSNCRAYVQMWWQQLAPCHYTTADTAVIMPMLIQVCKEGSDPDHPYGASSVKPSSGNTFRSFEEVLNNYNSTHGISNPLSCNAYLLPAPKPYDQQAAYNAKPVFTKPDSCECAHISQLHTSYLAVAGSYANFSAYLDSNYHTKIADSILTLLLSRCSTAGTCTYLLTPVYLPPVLQCSTGDVCANCSIINTTYSKFKTAFPGVVPTTSNSDSLQKVKNTLFENFMNYKLGFVKHTGDYLQFITNCNQSAIATKCDSLALIQRNYLAGDYRVKHYDAGGCDTTNWKIDFGGNVNNTGLTLSDVFQGGVATMPAGFNMQGHNHVDIDYYTDSLCVDSAGFTFETRLKCPDSTILSNGTLNSYWIWLYGNQPAGWILGSISPTDGQGVAVCTHASSSDPLKVCAVDNVPGQHLNDWKVIKLKTVGRNFYYYIDDTLQATRTLDYPITKLYAWTFTQFSAKGAIDYIHIYNNTGTPIFSEDFNGCGSMSYPAASSNCNCQSQFTTYFNQQKGTSYTYSQIDSMYNACGVLLTPCSDTMATKLKYYNDEFVNNYYNYGRKYDSNGCDTMTWKVDYGPSINQTGVAHNKIFHDGVMQYPDTLGKAPNTGRVDYDYEVRDSACVGGHFSIEYRIKDPLSGLSAAHKTIMEFFSQLGTYAKKFYINMDYMADAGNTIAYLDYAVPANSRGYTVPEFRQDYSNWRVVKFEMNDTIVKFYVDGVLLKTLAFPQGTGMQKVYGLGLSARGDHRLSAQYDYIRMYDGNGTMFYDDEFNDCSNPPVFSKYIECPKPICSTAFTTYYNQQRGTSYTYAQIDSVYRKYGVSLSVCPPSNLTLCGRSEPVFAPVSLNDIDNCSDSSFFAISKGTELYNSYTDSLKNNFDSLYHAKCLQAYKYESFTVTRPVSEYHYTLYYYDQAGGLLKTVPPQGVDVTVYNRTTYFDSVATARQNGTVYGPKHALLTQYRYNTLSQVKAQVTPDAGLSTFWYDRLGRLVISQNARQKAVSATENNRQYSYTTYDYLGRVNEVGQVSNTTANGAITDSIARVQSLLDSWMLALINKKEQVTRTYYDLAYPYTNAIPLTARNLRNRVAYTSLTNGNSSTDYNSASFYSYDIHGNVDTLLQDYGGSLTMATANIMNRNVNRWERIVYKYDLISGKVNHVAYNPRYYDVTTQAWVTPYNQFFHRYSYDAENRLTLVETSKDSIAWEKDARYEYYKHGPLARTLIGDQQVQGMDYAYTLQGWLKGVNSTTATSSADMGLDGKIGGQGINIARDVVGYSLNYYGTDYAPIGTSVNPFPNTSTPLTTKSAYRPLYNGNISSMTVNIKPFNQPYLYDYKYDQLNRLTGMDTYQGLDTANNNWTAISFTRAFNERVSYDGNGNIQKYNRYFSDTALANIMDKLTYNYVAGTNRLNYVKDSSSGGVNTNYKIKQQVANNYAYDEIGNLIKDSSEYIPTNGIKWNVYGKITEINHSQSAVLFNTKKINYTYDAGGNRIGKRVVRFGSTKVEYTWYVRDASGNVMQVYTAAKDTLAGDTTDAARLTRLSSNDLIWQESHLYGSSRLGVYNTIVAAEINAQGSVYYSSRGYKFYEIPNHLGNVLAVISDKKLAHTTNGTTMDYYNPEVVTVTDYYPFGMVSRNVYSGFQATDYRYGFNGKENDKDVKGSGDQIDYGARIYDPRLGRFLSVDPLQKSYPWYSPYQYAGDKPVWKRDIDGLEEEGEEGREEREEFAEERARERETIARGRQFSGYTPEDQAARRRTIDELKNETSRERESRIKRTIAIWNNYARNGVNAAQQSFGGDPLQNAVRQFSITRFQNTINKQNAEAFEGIVKNSLLTNKNSSEVASQVTLLVKGQLNGQNVSVRIRIDNITSTNGVLDLTEAKFSVEQITGANYAKTLTGNQQKAFDVIANGTGVSIFVRGNNADQSIGIKSGTDITGRIADIKIVANNPMTSQPQTVKTVPLATPAKQQP